MKKTLTVLAVVIVLFSTAVLAEDLSAGTDHQDLFRFASFSEAVKAANETAEAGDTPYGISSEGYCVALIRRDGRFFRTVTFLDEHGKELYAAYLDTRSENGEFAEEEYKTLDAYIMTLPVQYTEELTVVPLSREELDAMAGKTLWDVVLEPSGMQIQDRPDNVEAGKDIVFRASKGFCEYELVVNESAEVYQELRAADRNPNDYLNLTIRSAKYACISHNALNLHYQADGTFVPEPEPYLEGYDYDLMNQIVDRLTAAWEGREPDQEAKEAMIAELTEEHPEAADMIRQIVETLHH